VRAARRQAEGELQGERGRGGGSAAKPDAETRNRVADLEQENKTLRQRVEAARLRVHDLLSRLTFSRGAGARGRGTGGCARRARHSRCQRRGSVSTKSTAVQGDDRRRGVHGAVRPAPEYTREVAAYVDQALKKVLSQGPIVETHKAAILARWNHERVVPGEEGRARGRRAPCGTGGRSDEAAPAGERKAVTSSSPSLVRKWCFSDRRHSLRLRRSDAGDRSYGGLAGGVLSLLGGSVAAGVLFFVVGRRVERRTADAAARAAAARTSGCWGKHDSASCSRRKKS